MDNLMHALIFYVLGTGARTFYGFVAKVVTSNNSTLQLDTKYWVTVIISSTRIIQDLFLCYCSLTKNWAHRYN